MLHECQNPFIKHYKTAKQCLDTYNPAAGTMEAGADQRRENLPTTNEVVVLIPDEYGEPGFQDIVLAERVLDQNSTQLH